MYQFNYHQCSDETTTTCIVPAKWLEKPLPAMGGAIVYVDNSQKKMLSGHVFEFTDLEPDGSVCTVSLEIYYLKENAGKQMPATRENRIDVPVQIHYRASDKHDTGCDIEVVLLSHFFGAFNAESSWGNYFVDYADLVSMLSMSTDFVLEFGIGETPADILPGIFKRLSCSEAKCAFLMLYNDYQRFRLAYVDDMMKAFATSFVDANLLFGNAAVDQDKLLISALVGR